MVMIENVIKEAHESEKEAIKDEADAQAGYEEFIKNSNAAIEKASNEIVAKTEQKAETEATMVQAKSDLDSAVRENALLMNVPSRLIGAFCEAPLVQAFPTFTLVSQRFDTSFLSLALASSRNSKRTQNSEERIV